MKTIRSAADAYELFEFVSKEKQEVVWAAFLDSRLDVIGVKEIFRGTITAALASPREILREALLVNAVHLLVAHNHPSNHPRPSPRDRDFTGQLFRACRDIGIPLVDHVIVCDGGRYFSFAEAGPPWKEKKKRVGLQAVSATSSRSRE